MPKRELKFEGECEPYGGEWSATSPEIGGRHVINEIDAVFGSYPQKPNLKVYLGVEPKPPLCAEGETFTSTGFGGTDVTPADSPEIMVGGLDLMDKLYDLDGRHVLLIIEEV